jgi:hypothetical protein
MYRSIKSSRRAIEMADINDKRYRVPGTSAINWSKYSRENIAKDPPKYKVGDMVILTHEVEILKVYQDCDGTPLYQVDSNGYGISDNQLSPVAHKE